MENQIYQPLAARMRPTDIRQFIGQQHLLAADAPLGKAITAGHLHSFILWGPPGSGKTTLANLLAKQANAHVEKISAVLAGVKEIRKVVEIAQELRQQSGQRLVLFVDEVHRFNKSQQDAFLPHVESGLITLIGATTENPSYALNNALLSRARVYILKALSEEHIVTILQNGLHCLAEQQTINCDISVIKQLAATVDGDARRALNLLELAVDLAEDANITADTLQQLASAQLRRFDNHGNEFYDQISALHKSVRGSAPDAALYWLTRMLDGGCDPQYIARRMLRMASEDIGNADPRALSITLDAWQCYERLGSPEGELALAQAVVYLAVAPKSNAIYLAQKAASAAVKQGGSLPVPENIRHKPVNYRYAHDEPEAYAAGENYFPTDMPGQIFYQPVDRGLEIKIKQKLIRLKEFDTIAKQSQQRKIHD